MPVLKYGTDSSVQIEFAADVRHHECGWPQGEPLGDVAAAVDAALARPLDYPPLGQSTTPGDRVVVAVDCGLPGAAEVTAAVVRSLVAAGVDPDSISVLRNAPDVDPGAENPCRLLNGEFGERIKLLTHNPSDRGWLAYLAATERGDPIMLNRLLIDADLVITVGCLRAPGSTYFGVHTPVFPALADANTQARFRRDQCQIVVGTRRVPSMGNGTRRMASTHNGTRRVPTTNGTRRVPTTLQLAEEVDQVAWLLGINFTVQLVPGAGEEVLQVVAGQCEAVRRRGSELYRAAWRSAAQQADLVVAAIAGGPAQQTWENLGRALEAAVALAEEDRPIAVCCELAAAPGAGVQRLLRAHSRETALRHIRRDSPADAVPATQLARALERNRVYLLSGLDPSLVEDLDMVPVGGPDELARLARRHESCVLLANAPRAIVAVEEE